MGRHTDHQRRADAVLARIGFGDEHEAARIRLEAETAAKERAVDPRAGRAGGHPARRPPGQAATRPGGPAPSDRMRIGYAHGDAVRESAAAADAQMCSLRPGP